MNRVLAGAIVTLFCLSVTVGPWQSKPGLAEVARAGQATPLESLPFTHATAVTVLTPSKPGAYRGFSVARGLQFTAHNPGAVDSALEFHLGGRYTSLTGTMYIDSASQEAAILAIQDISNPVAGVKQLYQSTVSGQTTFNLDLHGVQEISIGVQQSGCCGSGAVADLVSNLLGAGPTTITVLSPAANAVIPRATPVSFLWRRYPGAAGYVLSVSLVRQSTKQVISSSTRLGFTRLVLAGTSYTWTTVGFLSGLYELNVVPVDKFGNSIASGSAGVRFTVSS